MTLVLFLFLFIVNSWFHRLRRTQSSRATLLSPEQLLGNQIYEITNKIDNLNVELTSVLKNTSEIKRNIKNLEASGATPELLERRKKQQQESDLRKENILKKLKQLETELSRKEKEKMTAT